MSHKTTYKVLLINGPNLNMLGKREPEIYGALTLATIENNCQEIFIQASQELGITIEFAAFQSNHQGVLVDKIQEQFNDCDYIIINPGAYGHTSIAIRDALLSVAIPFIEVHLSNIYAREEFRHHSYLSDIALGLICGFKELGYTNACNNIVSLIKNKLS